MISQNKKQSVALSSVFASVLLTGLKLVVGLLTGSIGILSEAAHSALDFGAASLTYFAVRVGDKPADERHPYGHTKVESVSALIETGLLFLTCAWIISESVQRLFFKKIEVEVAWYSFAVLIIAILVDFSRSRALAKVAKETNSQALEADALHFSSDILSSLVVLGGLILVMFGVGNGDAFAAIGVAFFVGIAGFKLGKRTIDVLVDAAPEGLAERIAELSKKIEGVIAVEKVRVRPAGAIVFVDMVVMVSRSLPLNRAQIIYKAIEDKVHQIVPEADVTIHTQPLPLDSETIIQQIQVVAAENDLSVHDVVVHTQDKTRYVSFDLEVEATLTIRQAHQAASRLEKAIKEEIGADVKINSHIEPLKTEVILGQMLPESTELKIKGGILAISKKISLIKEVHDIQVRKSQNKLFISLHCLFAGSTQLEDAHRSASRYEYLVKEAVPNVQRVVVHIEPIN